MFKNAIEHLKLSLGRQPTPQEISKETDINISEIEILLTELRKDLIDDGKDFATKNNFKFENDAVESSIAENIYFYFKLQRATGI